MKKIISSFLVVSLGAVVLIAGEPPSKEMQKGMAELKKVATFLEKNMMGKSLIRESHKNIAQDTLYTDFVARTTLHGLERTETGLRYIQTHVIEQTLWDLDQYGKKIGKGRTKNRTLTSCDEIRISKATGDLIGYSYGVTNTIMDPIGDAGIIRSYKVVNDQLHIWSEGMNYGACFAQNNTYKPCTSITKKVYSIDNDKLVQTSTSTMYHVNPKTFEKTIYKKDAVTTKTVRER